MIENADTLGGTPARDVALACLVSGIEAAHPGRVVRETVGLDDDTLRIGTATYDLSEFERLVVLGGGKAAGTISNELADILGTRITAGVVVAPEPIDAAQIKVIVGDHPVPSDRGVAGAHEVLELARNADARTLVLAVITGGGSALLPAPVGIDLAELQAVTNTLLESGASIDEINAVRKHLSAIKGGALAQAAAPATVIGLLMSDVVGNDPSVIASGPTAPDDTTYNDAISVLNRYADSIPQSVRTRLEAGRDGRLTETPPSSDPLFERVHNYILADGFTAVSAAQGIAERHGYTPLILSSRVRGEAREAAKTHIAIAEETHATGHPIEPPSIVLSGGETTVTVRGDGRGGPNQEFALSGALDIEQAILASVDTDGHDGSTDAAGGLVGPRTVDDREAAVAALGENDAYSYLQDRDALVYTGPTGTNVNDLRVLVIDRD